MSSIDTLFISQFLNQYECGKLDVSLLSSLEVGILENGGELFSALHILLKEKGLDKYEQVALLMEIAETIIDQNIFIGTYLMARLYPLAGSAGNHEVLDAIRIWMSQASSKEAEDALNQLLSEKASSSLKKQVQLWLQRIYAC